MVDVRVELKCPAVENSHMTFSFEDYRDITERKAIQAIVGCGCSVSLRFGCRWRGSLEGKDSRAVAGTQTRGSNSRAVAGRPGFDPRSRRFCWLSFAVFVVGKLQCAETVAHMCRRCRGSPEC
jgi:hypothetical protein